MRHRQAPRPICRQHDRQQQDGGCRDLPGSGGKRRGAQAREAATENAGEIIKNLTRLYNRARQAQITKEIAEVIGGAEALK